VADPTKAAQTVTRVLVLKIGNRMFGLVVDSIVGGEETLIKPVPVYLKECDCYSGVTILGDGKTAMILDPEGIIRRAKLKFYGEGQPENEGELKENEAAESQNLLLFTCSGSETFALDLSVIARIEKIQSGDLEKVGEHEFVKFNNNSLRVIRPENYLPVNRSQKKLEKYYVIIPKLVSHPIGILVEKITDNISTQIRLNTEEFQNDGLIGSAIYNHRLILIINIYELFAKADPGHYSLKQVSALGAHQRVLLVEDTQFFQRIETKYLTAAGYEVVLAKNGREALEHLAEEHFDILVSDIQMPVMDGLKLIAQIRDNPELKYLPAIALTSMSDEGAKKTVLESGFDYYEWKLDGDHLLQTMDQAFQSARGDRNL
jgi:two-component system chemotaxis sensor kinase CheA